MPEMETGKLNPLRVLSDSIEEAMRINPLFPAVVRLAPWLRRRHLRVKIRGTGVIDFRAGDSDRHVLHQIFASREYDLSVYPQYASILRVYNSLLAQGKTPIVIDAGANIGASSLWFARQFPKAHIVAVEPAPENAALCRKNTAQLPNATVVQAAIGGSHGAAVLDNPTAEPISFRTTRNNVGSIPVLTISELESSISNGILFIIKIDIEGFESDVFAGDLAWLDRTTAAVIVEVHDWLLPGLKTSRSVQQAMALRDFDLIISGENLIYVRPEGGDRGP